MNVTLPVSIPGFGIVMVTYTEDGRVVSISSTSPVFVFLFGPEVDLNINNGIDGLILQIQVILFLLGLAPEPQGNAMTRAAAAARSR